MNAKGRLRSRAGFADPDWLVGISICLVLGMLILPFASRDDLIGWIRAILSPILILPFVFIIVLGVYQRIRDLLVTPETVVKEGDESDDESG